MLYEMVAGRRAFDKAIDALAPDPLAGTEGTTYPVWSPDGRQIAFFATGKLKKIDVSTRGAAQTLADAPDNRGAAWSVDDVILFAARQQTSHRWPSFLPDGSY